ncbi:type III-A CRISPR-associated protein Cas10/Csm1 [Pseudothermotoga sp. U03pept]|uniref:type III-A CRISPR-associated protein Cas10/Csm1 n=1 Tax=Pseudothermotoga sp. U03pept TaxID=3447012 RepID=UPI003F09D36A
MTDKREFLAIGALVHDIGKLVRRAELADKTQPHTLAGSIFINQVEVDGKKIFAPYQDMIYHHHEKDIDKAEPLTWYVCLADNIASSERQTTQEEGFEEKRCLENILARVGCDKNPPKRGYFKPSAVGDVDHPVDEFVAESSEFRKLYEGFVKEAEHLPLTVENLRFLLYKYLSFIPQSTQKSGIMDISLYDHLKVTAMIALSLYDYVQANGIEINTYEDLKKLQEKNDVLLLVEGDVSGIQNFISRVSSKGALRSFRGRSVFIELLQEVIVDKILTRTGFYRTNVHFVGGGHFYLVISNTRQNIEKIAEVQREVNQWLLERSPDMKLIIESQSMAVKDIENPSEIFEKLNDKMRRKKLRMYSVEELEEIFDLGNIKSVRNLQTCKVCGRRATELHSIRENEPALACDFCKQMYELGKQVMQAKYFSEDPQGDFEILNKRYSFTNQPLSGKNYVLDVSRIGKDRLSEDRELIFIDTVTYAKHEEFEELAKESAGKKLACFQADLDGLGAIFRNGLDLRTLSRMSTLSRLLTYFFKHKIKELVKGKNIAVIYSGGDDLFIVGGWEDVLEFAYQMRAEFEQFTSKNPNLSYTASFVLCDEKESASKMKEMAEEAEKIGKDQPGKNRIVFYHGISRYQEENRTRFHRAQAITWTDFMKRTYPVYEKLLTLAKSVDRSVIRKMLELSLEDSPLNRAFLAYIEAREDEKDKEFVKHIREKEIPALNSMIQLIDLKARKGE